MLEAGLRDSLLGPGVAARTGGEGSSDVVLRSPPPPFLTNSPTGVRLAVTFGSEAQLSQKS